jgi:hypothetical protein
MWRALFVGCVRVKDPALAGPKGRWAEPNLRSYGNPPSKAAVPFEHLDKEETRSKTPGIRSNP